MIISTDPSDSHPIYQQIARQIIHHIQSGQINHGDKLPTATELAASLTVNRNTVLQAYRQLRDDGFVELRRGRGAIALNPGHPPDPVQIALDQLVDTARQAGLSLKEITTELQRKGLS